MSMPVPEMKARWSGLLALRSAFDGVIQAAQDHPALALELTTAQDRGRFVNLRNLMAAEIEKIKAGTYNPPAA